MRSALEGFIEEQTIYRRMDTGMADTSHILSQNIA